MLICQNCTTTNVLQQKAHSVLHEKHCYLNTKNACVSHLSWNKRFYMLPVIHMPRITTRLKKSIKRFGFLIWSILLTCSFLFVASHVCMLEYFVISCLIQFVRFLKDWVCVLLNNVWARQDISLGFSLNHMNFLLYVVIWNNITARVMLYFKYFNIVNNLNAFLWKVFRLIT